MNLKSIAIITSIALLPIAGIGQAQPPPAPPAPHAKHDNGPKVPVIFLGVETSPVPSVVTEQLGLTKGFGLVVDYVVPDSPAAAAGVQKNDILKLLNEQILVEPSQLRKLLQTFSEGTDVTLTVLRKGQEQRITVKLTKKEVPQRHSLLPGFDHEWHWNFDGNGDFGEQMRDMKEQLREQLGNAREVVREAGSKAREEARRARDDARRAREQLKINEQVKVLTDRNGLRTTKIDIGKAQIVFSDDKGELKLEKVDGKKVLTAKDPQGKLIFSGPVETKEDLDKLPPEVRERYNKLEKNDLPAVAPPPPADNDEDEVDEDDEISETSL